MKLFSTALWVCLLAFSVAGCASLFGSIVDTGNVLRVREDVKPSANTKTEKYPITVRLNAYSDSRQTGNPRFLGSSTSRILGLTGNVILSDRDAAQLVAESLTKRLGEAGFQLVSDEIVVAQFQLSGSVKELSIDVKDRDYVNIAIESTLTEISSGKVIWSGVVVERSDRYAGVSGNSKKDVADYLRKELGIVTTKTSESILSVLMASRPELFNLEVGVKPVHGVTLYSNVLPGAASSVVPSSNVSELVTSNGTLSVSSVPPRAKVYVDGVYFGLTPLRAEIEVGVREVNVQLEGYQAAPEKVSVRKGDNTELELTLKLKN